MRKLENIIDIPIGTKIELSVIDPIEGKLDIGFVSQIEEYIDENAIRISAPILEAKVYPIRVNSHVEAYLFYKSNQIYRTAGYVENRFIVDNIALLDLRVTERLRKIQRRQFFRFSCSVSVVFYERHSSELGKDDMGIFGQTIDLSGGGFSALTDVPLCKDTLLKGKLKLDEDNIMDFNGKVIRCEKTVINNTLKYVSSISFIVIGYKERERIVEYIFNLQRLLLKKGHR